MAVYKVKRFSLFSGLFGSNKSKEIENKTFVVDMSDLENVSTINDIYKIYPDLKIVKNFINNYKLISSFNHLLDDYRIMVDCCALQSGLADDDSTEHIEYYRTHYNSNEIILVLNGFDEDLFYHTRLKVFFKMNNWDKKKYSKILSSDSLILSSKISLSNFIKEIHQGYEYAFDEELDELPEKEKKEVIDLWNKVKRIN
jgi:hypothetical protein